MLESLSFGLKDIIDITVVVFLVYQAYRLVRGTVAVNIFIGIAALFLLYKLVEALHMSLLSGILGQFMSIGVLALVILFQQEIRRFLILIGTNNFFTKHFFSRIKRAPNLPERLDVKEIASACFEMGKSRTGALIVIKKSSLPLIETSVGDVQNIVPTQSILESIFYKNSPLHDGAIVIEDGRIVATRVILPVSRNKNLPEEYGTRHRAAVGICEKSDAACIVVSEERGKVTYIKGETIEIMKDEKELETRIAQELEM